MSDIYFDPAGIAFYPSDIYKASEIPEYFMKLSHETYVEIMNAMPVSGVQALVDIGLISQSIADDFNARIHE
jgi:hypothetical protein